jgi:hypothetical protein
MGTEYIATRTSACAQRTWRGEGDPVAPLPGLDMASPLASGMAAGCISGEFIVIQILANKSTLPLAPQLSLSAAPQAQKPDSTPG